MKAGWKEYCLVSKRMRTFNSIDKSSLQSVRVSYYLKLVLNEQNKLIKKLKGVAEKRTGQDGV